MTAIDKSLEILSDAVVYSKYARWKPLLNRRELWPEVAKRYCDMLRRKFGFNHLMNIQEIEDAIVNYEVVPSMRGMQFGGLAIEEKNARIFNCCCAPLDSKKRFSELMYLLLCGVGTGYSVQKTHIDQWDRKVYPTEIDYQSYYYVEDSIEGWSDALKMVLDVYTDPDRMLPIIDYSKVRPAGSIIRSTGCKAPGPAKLNESIDNVIELLNRRSYSRDTQLSSLDCHDIMCHVADAVVAGGSRRSAMIVFFDCDDELMLWSKSRENLARNPQRYRANNSAVLVRGEHGEAELRNIFRVCEACGTGEPAHFWTYSRDELSNPCVEAQVFLQFCNLCSISARGISSQQEFNRRCRIAANIGTYQAAFTDFNYLSPEWKERTEKDALLGVSITGIALGTLDDIDLEEGARVVKQVNESLASEIGINKAARTTLVKPEGSSSCVLMTPSGIHPFESEYYIRRMTLYKGDDLYQFLFEQVPELVEDSIYNENEAYFCFPVKAPEGSVTSSESLEDFLERVKRFNMEWIKPGHRSGTRHNVSCTAKVGPDEWDDLINWMWANHENYNGISAFPREDNFFEQQIFEEIDKQRWEEMMSYIGDGIDFSQLREEEDKTDLSATIACAGPNGCEVSYL